jgi:3-hydroxyacyl-[acyl-carrier-protein] dehydratase
MTQADLFAAIPHRPPMLLLDEVVSRSGDHIVCRKTFRPDEFFFQGHYPDFPLVPGVILCESAMQAGAVLLSAQLAESEAGIPVATRMSDVRWKHMVRPGDSVDIDVTLNERLADAFYLTAKVSCGGKVAVHFTFACTIVRNSPGTPE